jgi:hypothetical protein
MAALAAPAWADDCPEPDMNSPEMAEIQSKMMATMGPGPEHALLTKMAGAWQGEMTAFIPGMGPMKSQVAETVDMILGGRFAYGTLTGNMMGMDTESITMMGFDRRHEVYTLVGFDTMGTYYITASGKYDPATKVMKLSGTDDDPIGGITQVYDIEFEFVNDDTIFTRLVFYCPTYGVTDGSGYKFMETTLTRKKS